MTSTPETSDPAPRRREIRRIVPPATALKALAHPIRMRMLGMLRLDGPATATQLAERLDVNSGATSYHLRQLESHGFIDEAANLGNRRDRWWKAAHEATGWDESLDDEESRDAADAFSQAVVIAQTDLVQHAVQERSRLPDDWRRASGSSDYFLAVTASQAEDILRRVTTILDEAKRTTPPVDQAPLGTRQWMVQIHAFPRPGRYLATDKAGEPGPRSAS